MFRIAFLLSLSAPAGIAIADPTRMLAVEVDHTVEVEVGTLIGFRCDDPKLLDGKMQTKKTERGEINVFIVKGVAAGKTLCRVGTDPMRPFQLFDVVVTDKPGRSK
jgi:hypothetical protein